MLTTGKSFQKYKILILILIFLTIGLFFLKYVIFHSYENKEIDGSGKNKIVLIIVDSADIKIINRLIGEERLPNLASFLKEGSYGEAIIPTLWTSSNIATIVTGKLPEEHGINTHFSLDSKSNKLQKTMFTQLKVEPIWELLKDNYSTALISFFESPIADEINNVMVSSLFNAKINFDSNNIKVSNSFGIDRLKLIKKRKLIYPLNLYDAFNLSFMEKTQQEMESKGLNLKLNSIVSDRFIESITYRLRKKAEIEKYSAETILSGIDAVYSSDKSAKVIYDYDALTKHITVELIKKRSSDIYIIYFLGIDPLGHIYYLEGWDINDTFNSSEQLFKYYEVIDSYIGDIMNAASKNTTFFVVSDHAHQNVSFNLFEESRLKKLSTSVAPHSKPGALFAKGPLIKQNNEIFNASLQDITPTIMCILAMPVNHKYFSGEVLVDIFTADFDYSNC